VVLDQPRVLRFSGLRRHPPFKGGVDVFVRCAPLGRMPTRYFGPFGPLHLAGNAQWLVTMLVLSLIRNCANSLAASH
jgi:hypothetical protein